MARIASVSGSAFHRPVWSKDTLREAVPTGDGTLRTFAAITELIRHVERAASSDIGIATHLIETIALALQSKTDPSLLMGVLLEGIVHTVLERVAAAEQRDTAIALCCLLWERVGRGQTGPGRGAFSAG